MERKFIALSLLLLDDMMPNLSTNMTKIDNVIRKVRLILFMIEGEES